MTMTKVIKYTRMSGRARRDKLIGKAKKILARRGVDQATVSEIVKEAGVSQGTFYLYFKDKQEIFLAIVDQVISDFKEALQSVRAGIPSGADPITQMKQGITAAFRFIEQNRDLYLIFTKVIFSENPLYQKKIREAYTIVKNETKSFLQLGIDQKKVRPLNLEIMSDIIVALLDRVALEYLSLSQGREIPQKVIDQVIDFCFHGILNEDKERRE